MFWRGQNLAGGGLCLPPVSGRRGPPARSDVPGEELRWMPEYTQFSTLDTRYDED
ncbi:hypothetical protein K430107D3_34360 [Dysosmobacter welbionis]